MWAVEGCSGIGRHEANRLLADDEQVVDVPPKLSARLGRSVGVMQAAQSVRGVSVNLQSHAVVSHAPS